jgi:hypothetical protein
MFHNDIEPQANQLLAYAADVNLLGDNIDTINKDYSIKTFN